MHRYEFPVMIGGIGAAFILWYIMFVHPPANFWLLMSLSTSFLAAISMILRFPPMEPEEWTWKHVWIGIIAAVILYILFVAGNSVSAWIVPGKDSQLANIYEKKETLAGWSVAGLLFFPIGFGEEMFWRGMVQRIATGRWGWKNGFLFTAFFYTAVHFATCNVLLIGAAFVCGCFWGLLYWRTNSLLPCLISHMLWDPFVFVILPIS